MRSSFIYPVLVFALLVAACSGDPSGEQAQNVDSYFLPDTTNVIPGDENTPPELHKVGNKEVLVNQTLELVLEAQDQDGDKLTFSAYGDLPEGSKFIKGDARFTWSPVSVGGPYLVTFVASDGKSFDSETVQLRAVAQKENHPPEFVDPGDQFLRQGEVYILRLEATDLDGDALEFRSGELPDGVQFETSSATLNWTPTVGQVGKEFRLSFTVTDQQAEASLDVRFLVGDETSNKPPLVAPIPGQQASVGKKLVLGLIAEDPEDDPLTFGVKGDLPAGASFDQAAAELTWTPTQAQANQSFTVTFKISDPTHTVHVDVNFMVAEQSTDDCQPDQFEPNDSPEAASPLAQGFYADLQLCDSVGSPTDKDYYLVTLAKDDRIDAEINFSSDEGDLDLALYQTGTSSPVAQSSSLASRESISYTTLVAGTFLLTVTGMSAGLDGVPYDLTMGITGGQTNPPLCEDDDLEENDFLVQAALIQKNALLPDLQLCKDDPDFYKVELAAGDSFLASIDFKNQDGDLDLFLFGPGGGENLLDKSETTADSETVGLDSVTQAGTYILEVLGYESAQNSYTLTTISGEAQECEPDMLEPNNSKAEAVLFLDDQVMESLTICADEDWYSIDVLEGQTMGIMVDYVYTGDGDFAPYVEVETPSGSNFGVVCSANQCSTTAQIQVTGRAYLKIWGKVGIVYDLLLAADGQQDPGAGSCKDKCGEQSGQCWCDEQCAQFGDCCEDRCTFCDCSI